METEIIRPFPKNRLVLSDIYDIFLKKHYMTGIVEVDVTEAKNKISMSKSRGREVSFSGWILHCLSIAIQKHPQVYAYRKGKGQVIQFSEIDIILMIEKEVESTKMPIPHSVRNSQGKTLEDITEEIRSAQSSLSSESNQLLSDHWMLKFYQYIPKWIRIKLLERYIQNPRYIKKQGGLAVVTSVGMFASSYGWILGFGGITPLNISVGTISRQPKLINGELQPRSVLNLTISIDHDIVDGDPAARFASDFIDLMENGYGLVDDTK